MMPRDEDQGEEVTDGSWSGERHMVERGGLKKKAVAAAVVVEVMGRGDVRRREGDDERSAGGVKVIGEGCADGPISQSLRGSRVSSTLLT
eukprot:evm.model.NODE_49302_length_5853_cov_17.424227.4